MKRLPIEKISISNKNQTVNTPVSLPVTHFEQKPINTFLSPIPEKLNILISIGAIAISITALYFASHSANVLSLFFWATIFGLVGNTHFSLLHEAVHGILSPNKKSNAILGQIHAAFFPTAFTVQKIFHLGHHQRNRTDAEMFDYYYPGDNVWMKKLVIVGLFSGLYWSSAPFACLLLLFAPNQLLQSPVRETTLMKLTSFDAMLKGLDRSKIPWKRIRAEVLVTLMIQTSVFYFFDLNLFAWFICHLLFGIFWGSLQYTDHAFSPRSIRDGAWNLKVNPFIRAVFLNYHLHLNHHQHPSLPWVHLPKVTQPGSIKTPSFFEIYIKLWKGPYPVTEPSPERDYKLEEDLFKDNTDAGSLFLK